MDLGERDDQKGVVIFDIGPEGLQGEPATLALPATPVYEINILTPREELPELRKRHPQPSQDLVRIACTYTAGADNREETLRELEQIFPRWYDRTVREANALGPTLTTGEPSRSKSFEETVRDYLSQELTNHPDELRDAVLSKANALLAELERKETS
jgi:hypothetical protein